MRATCCLLAGLLTSASLVAQTSVESTRIQGELQRVENGRSFEVDPQVISLRFEAAPGDPAGALAAVTAEAGLDGELALLRSNRLGIHDVRLPQGSDVLGVVAALAATGRFDFVEANLFGSYVGVPDDASFAAQWNLHNTGQTGGSVDADVDAPEAWDLQDGDPSVVIAVLDGGADWTHPDLAAGLWANTDEVLDGSDTDGNGYVDDIRGWDFENGDNDPMGSIDHGTWIAGCVAAMGDNALGIAGLAGGASDGHGCLVLNSCVGALVPMSSVIDDAILYAVDNGAKVIVMSLEMGATAAIEQALVEAASAGVFLVAASGNDGAGVGYPASLPQVMAVASSDDGDAASAFSNAGPEVEVAAPGERVLLTSMGGGYGTASGTSIAAAHVAALAGLLFSEKPALTAAQVRQAIRDSADDVDAPGFDQATGDGRINAHEALLSVSGAVQGQLLPYGSGLAGTGGVPAIGASGGVPNLGDTDFAVTLDNALEDVTTYFALGIVGAAFPFKQGTLYVDVSQCHTIIPVSTLAGATEINLPIPSDPAIEGGSLYTQWLVTDSGAPAGFAMTAGLQLVIGA